MMFKTRAPDKEVCSQAHYGYWLVLVSDHIDHVRWMDVHVAGDIMILLGFAL